MEYKKAHEGVVRVRNEAAELGAAAGWNARPVSRVLEPHRKLAITTSKNPPQELWPDKEGRGRLRSGAMSSGSSSAAAERGPAAALHSHASSRRSTIDAAEPQPEWGQVQNNDLFRVIRAVDAVKQQQQQRARGAAPGALRPQQQHPGTIDPSPCPLSPSKPQGSGGGGSGRQARDGGNLGALAATLSGLGVQLDRRHQPDALKPSVADIAAGINRTVNALARIATQLGDDQTGPRQQQQQQQPMSSEEEQPTQQRQRKQWDRQQQQQQDVDVDKGSEQDRPAKRSPSDALKGASREQLQQLRSELDLLNSTVLRSRRAQQGAPADAFGMRGLDKSGGDASSVLATTQAEEAPCAAAEEQAAAAGVSDPPQPKPKQEQEQEQPRSLHHHGQQHHPSCHDMVHEATHQLKQLQAENRELRTHLGQAEHSVSDLRQQLINFQLAIDRTGGVDAGQLLLQNQKLQRGLHAKEQALVAAHAALMAQSATSSDQRVATLQGRLREAQAQLHARDAALSAAEAELRDLRGRQQDLQQRAAQQQLRRRHQGAAAGGSGASLSSPEVSESGSGDDSGDAAAGAGVGRHGTHRGANKEAAAGDALLQRERERVASLQSTLSGYKSEAEAKDAELRALQLQVALMKQQQAAAAARSRTPVGVPNLDEALTQLAQRAQEAGELRAEVRRGEEVRGAALAEQEAAFERRLAVQQRVADAAQEEVRVLFWGEG